MCAHVYMQVHVGIYGGQKRILGSRERELQVVVSLPIVDAGNWIVVLWKSSKYSYLLSYLSSPGHSVKAEICFCIIWQFRDGWTRSGEVTSLFQLLGCQRLRKLQFFSHLMHLTQKGQWKINRSDCTFFSGQNLDVPGPCFTSRETGDYCLL